MPSGAVDRSGESDIQREKPFVRRSKVLEKLRSGHYVHVPMIGQIPHWKVAEMVGLVGFDGLWLDMEHKEFSYETLALMMLACRATDMDAMVRVVKGTYNCYIRPLEAGATGLMVPHVTSGDEAHAIVSMCKFQPMGRRAIDGANIDANYTLAAPADYLAVSNRETFLVVQIEDREAVDEIDAIAATPGIDVLFIGPADLSHSYGLYPTGGQDVVEEAVAKVADACARHGKWWGLPCSDRAHAQALLARGARFLTAGSEVVALAQAFTRLKRDYDGLDIPAPAG